MKTSALAVAAAIAFGLAGAAPAAAQPHRTVVTHSRTVVVHRTNVTHADNGRHHGWHKRRQVCRVTVRHHHRKRVCTWVRR
jgi:hypothetical protein